MSAFPPERSPYLNIIQKLCWPKGVIERFMDLALPRGVSVRGKVIEEGSGKPIAGARIGYISNPDRDERSGAFNTRAVTAADGSFEFGVMPNPGYLTVLGPSEDYVLQEIGLRMARAGQPGGAGHTPTPSRAGFEAGQREPGHRARAPAQRPVMGHVFGPDGRPVRGGQVISRVTLRPPADSLAVLDGRLPRCAVRDGHFAVHGLAEDADVPVYFLDAKNNLGATALVGQFGTQWFCDRAPPAVRRGPGATGRPSRQAGRSIARRHESHVTMSVVTPGPHSYSHDQGDKSRLWADQDFLTRFDPIHYPNGLVSDAQGQLTLPALFPAGTHRLYEETWPKGRPPAPQGIHRQTRRDPRPGRHPDRKAAGRAMSDAKRQTVDASRLPINSL